MERQEKRGEWECDGLRTAGAMNRRSTLSGWIARSPWAGDGVLEKRNWSWVEDVWHEMRWLAELKSAVRPFCKNLPSRLLGR